MTLPAHPLSTCRSRWRRAAVPAGTVLALLAGLVPAGVAGAGPAAALASNCSQSGPTTVTCTFSYTGGAQSFTVPAGVSSITVTADGAQGGGPSFGPASAMFTNATNSGNGQVVISYTGTAAATATAVSAPASGATGIAIPAGSITAMLSGATSDATGTITFTVFGPQSSPPAGCSSGGTAVGSAAVAGNGSYNPSAGFTPASAGTYWWYASYGGDTKNSASASGCGPGMTSTVVTTPPADPSLTNIGSPNPVISGQQLTYTVTVTNTGGQAATGVNVTDVLPASAHFRSAAVTQGTCSRPGPSGGGTVVCHTADLAGGGHATVTIVLLVTRPGMLTATAVTAAANVTADSDDTATATTTVRGG